MDLGICVKGGSELHSFMIGLFDKEHKTRIAGSCAFDDWFEASPTPPKEGLSNAQNLQTKKPD